MEDKAEMKRIIQELRKNIETNKVKIVSNDKPLKEMISKIRHVYTVKEWPNCFPIDRTIKRIKSRNVYRKERRKPPYKFGLLTVHKADALIGFESSRTYLSAVDPMTTTTYFNTVVGSSNGPVYRVRAEDDPGTVYSSRDIDQVWQQIVDTANGIRDHTRSKKVSGKFFFGLDRLKVMNSINDE